MPRKKLDNPEDILSQPIIVRVTEKVFKRLEKIQQESGCQSIGEVARMILSGEPINCFYKDVSLNAPMEEMALIRKELKAIGININQQTKFFHLSKSEAQRAFFWLLHDMTMSFTKNRYPNYQKVLKQLLKNIL